MVALVSSSFSCAFVHIITEIAITKIAALTGAGKGAKGIIT